MIEQNQNIGLLRFATAGSVDDGKSTLIGRLLHDSKSIFEDQLSSIKDYSKTHRDQELDYSLVTDGLKSEREQGITIDVAYRFSPLPEGGSLLQTLLGMNNIQGIWLPEHLMPHLP
ncbi:MAG: GTP-binding protein [Methanolobus sp.]